MRQLNMISCGNWCLEVSICTLIKKGSLVRRSIDGIKRILRVIRIWATIYRWCSDQHNRSFCVQFVSIQLLNETVESEVGIETSPSTANWASICIPQTQIINPKRVELVIVLICSQSKRRNVIVTIDRIRYSEPWR